VNYLVATIIGALAGLHVSIWGYYKDAPHEGFSWPRFFRSTVVGAAVGAVGHYYVRWDLAADPGARFVYWGLCYCLERAVSEFWKYFIREEDQGKYFIPMQFGIMGRPIKDPRIRIPIGIAIGVLCVLLGLGLISLDRRYAHDLPPWATVVTVGAAFGWISAFGGAWKDAPIEGFETFKFFRSPGIAAAWALIVIQLQTSWVVLALAAEGFTVASIETYKKFGFPSKPPGKFAGKPVRFPEHLVRRRKFVAPYAVIWALVLGHLAWGLAMR
jgi:hypothetical protein